MNLLPWYSCLESGVISFGKTQDHEELLVVDQKTGRFRHIPHREKLKEGESANLRTISAYANRSVSSPAIYANHAGAIANIRQNIVALNEKIDHHNARLHKKWFYLIASWIGLGGWLDSQYGATRVAEPNLSLCEVDSVELLAMHPEKKALLEQNDLLPVSKCTMHGTTVYLSKPFFGKELDNSFEGRPRRELFCIGYVEVEEEGEKRHVPQLFYRSGTHCLWRVLPWIHGFQYGKGVVNRESSVNLPMELNLLLTKRATEGKVTYADKKMEVDTLIDQLLATENVNGEEANFTALHPEAPSPFLPQDGADLAHWMVFMETKVDARAISFARGSEPDFSRAVLETIEGAMCGDISAYIVPSKCGNYQYLYYYTQAELPPDWQEKEPHGALVAIDYVGEGQQLTRYGTYKRGTDPLGVDLPIVEYACQCPNTTSGDSLISEDSVLHHTEQRDYSHLPTGQIRDQMAVVRPFLSWLGSPSA